MNARKFRFGAVVGKTYLILRNGHPIEVTYKGYQNKGYRFEMRNGAVFRVRNTKRILKQLCETS